MSMVGIRKFDETATLEAVMHLFWRRGYAGTSIDDIESATGVKRGSLYNAYGSKDDLFLLAMNRYGSTVEDPLLETLDEPDIGSALMTLFDTQLENLADTSRPESCFLANSLAELGNLEPRLGAALRERLRTSEDVIFARFEQARTAGELNEHTDIRALARYIASTLRIVPLATRASPDQDTAQDVAATALDAIMTRYVKN